MAVACERCRTMPRQRNERFCKECRKAVIQKLKNSGYLTNCGGGSGYRSADQKENVYETKHGRDD
jgi:hypothetical protein